MGQIGRPFVCAVALGLIVLAAPTIADEAGDSRPCEGVTVQFDNDEMGGTDRHYTGGLRLACLTAPPLLLQDGLLAAPDPDAIRKNRFTYALGQSAFTPDNLSRSEPIEDDQPYAGWLYLGFGLETETIPRADGPRHLDSMELQLGVVGPLSGAEQLQRLVHDLTGASNPKGWGNQLDNEPGVNVFYDRRWPGIREFAVTTEDRFPGLFLDVTPHLGLALGNVHTYGAGGLTVRLGRFQPDDHGPPVIRPALPGSDHFPRQEGASAYLFGGIEGRLVGRNIFLDGNSYADDGPSVDREVWLREARLGLVLTFGDVRLAYTHVFRSKEFEGQTPQTFGSIALTFRI